MIENNQVFRKIPLRYVLLVTLRNIVKCRRKEVKSYV